MLRHSRPSKDIMMSTWFKGNILNVDIPRHEMMVSGTDDRLLHKLGIWSTDLIPHGLVPQGFARTVPKHSRYSFEGDHAICRINFARGLKRIKSLEPENNANDFRR